MLNTNDLLRGTVVRSLVNAQGLKRGSTYVVKNVFRNPTAFGVFVEVEVERVAEHEPHFFVKNANLLLEIVE